MERFVEPAVVLSTVDYGEADRLVTLFCRGRGKLTAFAAGARKSKRRFAGALEPMTLLDAQLVERRGTTFRLDGAVIQRAFHEIRGDLGRIARALHAVELCRELCREHEPHPGLFDDLVAYLGELDAGRAGPTSLIAFELDALSQGGFQPRFDCCALCGGPLGPGTRFDPEHGGAVCEKDSARSTYGVPVKLETLASLRGLQEGKRTPLPAPERKAARELLNLFVAHQLGRPLRSVEFMVQVGVD
ncbi:MAG TPA: DNA repair protein RecO [Myxococcaceae bacterium]|nr:DNA repair protein RecO [Myxococcaceae bacterium]